MQFKFHPAREPSEVNDGVTDYLNLQTPRKIIKKQLNPSILC